MNRTIIAARVGHSVALTVSVLGGIIAALTAAPTLPVVALGSRLLLGAEITGALLIVGVLVVAVAVRGVGHGDAATGARGVTYPTDPARDRQLARLTRDVEGLHAKMAALEGIVRIDSEAEGY